MFAYSVETACDKNGVVLGYSVHPGNENDGKTFPSVYEKINHLDIEVVVGDTAYKTPAIAIRKSASTVRISANVR